MLSGPLGWDNCFCIDLVSLMVVRLFASHAQMSGLEFTMLSLMCGVLICQPKTDALPKEVDTCILATLRNIIKVLCCTQSSLFFPGFLSPQLKCLCGYQNSCNLSFFPY